jgi:endoglycosylceramidase
MSQRQGGWRPSVRVGGRRGRWIGCACLGALVAGGFTCVLILMVVVIATRQPGCDVVWEAGSLDELSSIDSPLTPTPDSGTTEHSLDWIHTDGERFLDSAGNVKILRGFVTITNNTDGSPLYYTREDYERMRALGANYQSIRVGAGVLGMCPDDPVDPVYLQRLDAMVALGKQVGMYSQFKLTVYDIDGSIGLQRRGFWEAIWANEDDEQQRIIEAWRVLWERYRDEPAVIGYDLLNEPEQGGLGGSEEEFLRDHLTPFYRAAIDELHAIDDRHLVFIQPPFGAPTYETPIQRGRVVYAPHFYPNIFRYLLLSDYSPRDYQATMERFAAEARLHNAPLFIGEYGMPWSARRDGDESREEDFRSLEQVANDLFDQHHVGFSRPWFSDDRAGIRLFIVLDLNWAIIRGTDGLDGEERRFITDVFATPYPGTVAGDLSSFGFGHDTKEFVLTYSPSTGKGLTEVFVPRTVHYPNGFTVTYDDGTTLVYDDTAPGGLRLAESPGGVDPSAFVWDESRQSLVIHEWVDRDSVTVRIHSH